MTVPSAPVHPRPRTLGRSALTGLAAGVVLVGVGAWFASRPASFGTLTYFQGIDTTFTPLLTDETVTPPLTPQWARTLGLVAVGAGLTILGYIAGWVVARRQRGPVQPVDPSR